MADDKKTTTTTKKDKDKPASGFLGSIGDFVTEHPALVASLLGGGLGATAGYTLPAEEDEGLPEGEKFQARLKRALLFGGIGAGGGGLIGYGLGQYGSSVPAQRRSPEEIASEGVDNTGKFIQALGSKWSGGVVGAGAGATGAHFAMQGLGNLTGSPLLNGGGASRLAFVNQARKLVGEQAYDAKRVTSGELTKDVSRLVRLAEAKSTPAATSKALKKLIAMQGRGDYAAGKAVLRAMGRPGGAARLGVKGAIAAGTAYGGWKLFDWLWGGDNNKNQQGG